MPFQSEKQRRFLWANEPEVARKWTEEYGSEPANEDHVAKKRKKGKHASTKALGGY